MKSVIFQGNTSVVFCSLCSKDPLESESRNIENSGKRPFGENE